MRKNGLLVGLCLMTLLAAPAKQAFAQAAPGVFADASHPAGPPDPEKLAQVWPANPAPNPAILFLCPILARSPLPRANIKR